MDFLMLNIKYQSTSFLGSILHQVDLWISQKIKFIQNCTTYLDAKEWNVIAHNTDGRKGVLFQEAQGLQ